MTICKLQASIKLFTFTPELFNEIVKLVYKADKIGILF